MAEDKYAGEALSEEELDGVAGGKLWEISEICIAAGKRMYIHEIPGYLKENFNIDAKIDGDTYTLYEGQANIYKRNGETLTHQQVIDIIKSR